MRLQHVFLAPLVLLVIPPAALFQQPLFFVLAVALVGLAGNVSGRSYLATTSSLSLLMLLIWGKASESILKTGALDTAVLLIEFSMVLFFMEASSTVLTFNRAFESLRKKDDEISQKQKGWLVNWLRGLLSRQGKVSRVHKHKQQPARRHCHDTLPRSRGSLLPAGFQKRTRGTRLVSSSTDIS